MMASAPTLYTVATCLVTFAVPIAGINMAIYRVIWDHTGVILKIFVVLDKTLSVEQCPHAEVFQCNNQNAPTM